MNRTRTLVRLSLVASLFALPGSVGCNQPDDQSEATAPLRIGLSNAPSLSAERGVQQFITNLASEGVLRVNQDGHIEPWLAESWNRSTDGRILTLQLRQNVQFHDGARVDAKTVVEILRDGLPRTLKSMFDDVESISADGDRVVRIVFRQPSSLIAESLMDVPITKKGSPLIGTGAFKATSSSSESTTTVSAFDGYYLGKPSLRQIAITTYPNIRAAWAEMLRDQLDMLYEVGADAIDTMRSASNVTLYTFDRPYQYLIFLNPKTPFLASAKVRQALNQAIDRDAVVKDGLGGHGTPSTGPVSSHHWAYSPVGSTFTYSPKEAVAKINTPFTIRCLTLAEPPFEHLALVVKQQLKAVGVTLDVIDVSSEQIGTALAKGDYDGVLLDPSSGWSLLRAYRWWHSKGPANVIGYSSVGVDAALDRVRASTTDDDYRSGVHAFEEAIANDPPAVFLAWSERSRAVSKRFNVSEQPRRDVLATLYLWRPSADNRTITH